MNLLKSLLRRIDMSNNDERLSLSEIVAVDGET